MAILGGKNLTIHTHGTSRRAKQAEEIWTHQKTLGHGGFGSVQLQANQSKREGSTRLRVVKSIIVSEEEVDKNRDFYVRELEAIIKFFQARYGELFVKSFGWFTSESTLYIAMEYFEIGDLQKFLDNKCKNHRVPEYQAHEIASQVLDALARMHEENFTHRDVKPANILIRSYPPDHPWVVKVADFGISKRHLGLSTDATTTVKGTPLFMPPELLGFGSKDSRSTDLYAADMWCYGQTVFKIICGRGAFISMSELYGFFFGHVPFPIPALVEVGVGEDAVAFLKSLLVCSPAERLTAAAALELPWMDTDINGSRKSSRPPSSYSDKVQAQPLGKESSIRTKPVFEMTTAPSASWPDDLSELRLDTEVLNIPQIPQNAPAEVEHTISRQVPPRYTNGSGLDSRFIGVTAASGSWTEALGNASTEVMVPEPAGTQNQTHLKALPVPEIELSTKPADVEILASGDRLKETLDPDLEKSTSEAIVAIGPRRIENSTTRVTVYPPSKVVLSPSKDMRRWEQTNTTEYGQDDWEVQICTENLSRYACGFLNDEQRPLIPSPSNTTWDSEKNRTDEHRRAGDNELRKRNYAEAQKYYRKVLRCRTMDERKDVTVICVIRCLGEVLYQLGPVVQSRHFHQISVNMVEQMFDFKAAELVVKFLRIILNERKPPKAFDVEHKVVILALQDSAVGYKNQEKHEEALIFHEIVLESALQMGNEELELESQHSLIYAHLKLSQVEAAAQTFQSYIQARKRKLGPTHISILNETYKFAIELDKRYHSPELSRIFASEFVRMTDQMQAQGAILGDEIQQKRETIMS
ncbi:unnamed protein product, partial [Clonostachys rosea]